MGHVLVTGAAGYIGSVLVRQLLAAGHNVRGLDSLLFGGESLVPVCANPRFEFMHGDVREPTAVATALAGVDAVVHLAAIVGDPACKQQPELARATNLDATLGLWEQVRAKESVSRFLFASTCSNYGKMSDPETFVTETSELAPISLYAETKVAVEEALLGRPRRASLTPTVLRFATVYGISSRMRFDLTVNEFMRDVATGRELEIFGEQFWRPYCHVEDLARSCCAVLDARPDRVSGEVFGVGDTGENYQKRMLADEILKIVPGASIRYVSRAEDPRDYRVDFSKIRNDLGFKVTRRVPDGLREIHDLIRSGLLPDPFAPRYGNT